MVGMGKCNSLLAEGEHTSFDKKFFVEEGSEEAEAWRRGLLEHARETHDRLFMGASASANATGCATATASDAAVPCVMSRRKFSCKALGDRLAGLAGFNLDRLSTTRKNALERVKACARGFENLKLERRTLQAKVANS